MVSVDGCNGIVGLGGTPSRVLSLFTVAPVVEPQFIPAISKNGNDIIYVPANSSIISLIILTPQNHNILGLSKLVFSATVFCCCSGGVAAYDVFF